MKWRVWKRWSLWGVTLLLMILVTWLFKPEQQSDFLYYWNASIDLTTYHKGGMLPLLYWVPRSLNVPSYWAACCINGMCWTVVYAALLRSTMQLRFAGILMGILGAWFVAHAPIVAGDLPSLALCMAGLLFLLDDHPLRNPSYQLHGWIIGVALMMIGASIRPMVAALIAALGWFGYAIVHPGQWLRAVFFHREQRLHVVFGVALAVGGGCCIDRVLRLQSHIADTEMSLLSGGITIYTGILAAVPGPHCGGWTKEGSAAAIEDLGLSAKDIFRKRVVTLSPEHVWQVIQCKWKRMVSEYRGNWLKELVKGNEQVTASAWRMMVLKGVNSAERQAARVAQYLCVLLTVALLIWKPLRQDRRCCAGIAIFVGMVLFHSLFEFQTRYFWPVYMMALMLVFLSARFRACHHSTL